VNHIAGVEVTEAVSGIGQLITSVSTGELKRGDTYKLKSVYVGDGLNVFQDISGHPI